MSSRLQAILLIEDNEDDVFLMRRALKKAGCGIPVHVVTDGQKALEYLDGAGEFSNREQFPVPALVFLDLKLPYLHGFEVLAWIRQQPTLENLPVVVLTSSAEERDRHKAGVLGAKAYLVKPPSRETLLPSLQFLASHTGAFPSTEACA